MFFLEIKVMNKLSKVSVVVSLLLAFSGLADAARTGGVYINAFAPHAGGVDVWIVDAGSGGKLGYTYLPLSHPNYKAIYAALLAAKIGDRVIDLETADGCIPGQNPDGSWIGCAIGFVVIP